MRRRFPGRRLRKPKSLGLSGVRLCIVFLSHQMRGGISSEKDHGSVYQVKGRIRIVDVNRSTWKSAITFHYFFVVGETVIDMQTLNGSWEALKTWKLAAR